ncbi:centrosomin-like isoform X3 [Prorops nasuta]|uniref:centrosomin-like isoform X3 n=1 Tax=Prorops nasuta TaxID=863751 RepID=UPI0034CD7A79
MEAPRFSFLQGSMFFGGHYSAQTQNSPPSPIRNSVWGSAYSPFKNMPLQDLTMNETLRLTKGANPWLPESPGGGGGVGATTGPGMAGTRGRTMKEYEDQLDSLKKENFNLKLRIFFLQERLGITSTEEDIIKSNIELKMENESLKKDLAKKQDLLNQGEQAMEFFKQQKETSSSLLKKMEALEKELEEKESILICSKQEEEQLREAIEEKEQIVRDHEESVKQLTLRLCNVQKSSEDKVKKLEADYEKALKMIQSFVARQQELETKCIMKERKIMDMQIQLSRMQTFEKDQKSREFCIKKELDSDTEDPERDQCNQRRFEEMERKIGELRRQVESNKTEKRMLEMKIQVSAEELQGRLQERDRRIMDLSKEKSQLQQELGKKLLEIERLRKAYEQLSKSESLRLTELEASSNNQKLLGELRQKNQEIEEKREKIEQLTKELHVKNQNLQKLVNTELWSKNKEIAKLHNHMTSQLSNDKSKKKSEVRESEAAVQLSNLIKRLTEIGIRVTFTNDVVQLNYVNGDECIDAKTMADYVKKLLEQKNKLEKEVDYLKWLKLISQPDAEDSGSETERVRKYCELLRSHLKELVRFMKEMLKNSGDSDTIGQEHKKIFLDVLMNSKLLSDDVLVALEEISIREMQFNVKVNRRDIRKSRSENILDLQHHHSTHSDSEEFSEPDRAVSLARIGLQQTRKKIVRPRVCKYTRTFSDSDDSLDYISYHKTNRNELAEIDSSRQIMELKDANNLLYCELCSLRKDLLTRIDLDSAFDEKFSPIIAKLEKSQEVCEKIESTLESKVNEFCTRDNNIGRRNDRWSLENEEERKTTEITTEAFLSLSAENERLRLRILKLEEETKVFNARVTTLRAELDHLTLSHSQILVENTKLTNEKLRLEKELRNTEARYDATLKSHELHRARMLELETANKELTRQVTICEASDSAPSSSGVSSIPTESNTHKQCDDGYQIYSTSQYWSVVNSPTLGTRSKSSCSPDLGIESDAALTITTPFKDNLKITECMTNLLSDEDANDNQRVRDIDSESPPPEEGLSEIAALKQENEVLKRRIAKTRKALEDTYQHVTASNKNKKNIEKAILQQLINTQSVLKKTRTYDELLN